VSASIPLVLSSMISFLASSFSDSGNIWKSSIEITLSKPFSVSNQLILSSKNCLDLNITVLLYNSNAAMISSLLLENPVLPVCNPASKGEVSLF
jgi:hypothetical protein